MLKLIEALVVKYREAVHKWLDCIEQAQMRAYNYDIPGDWQVTS